MPWQAMVSGMEADESARGTELEAGTRHQRYCRLVITWTLLLPSLPFPSLAFTWNAFQSFRSGRKGTSSSVDLLFSRPSDAPSADAVVTLF